MVRYEELIALIRMPPKYSRFLTVTINPKLNKKNPQYQFAATHSTLLRILDKYCSDYCKVTEVTEEGNVHYHLWFMLRNIHHMANLCVDMKNSKVLGFYCLDKNPIEKQDDVYKYLRGEAEGKDKTGKDLKMAHKLMPTESSLVWNYTPLMKLSDYKIDVSQLYEIPNEGLDIPE